MKKILLITLLLANYYVNGQNITINRTIEWDDNYLLSQKNFQIKTSSFFNAYFNHDHIPIFNEAINLSEIDINSIDIDVKITNIKYEAVSLRASKFKQSSDISTNINLNFNVFKGRDISYLDYNFYPFVNKNGQILRVKSFSLYIENKPTKTVNTQNTYAQNSVLNNGNWVKIGIPENGVYKLTFDELSNLGFSSPEEVRVFGNDAGMLSFWNDNSAPDDLIENYIYKGSNYILFYAEGASNWIYNENADIPHFSRVKNNFTDTAYYFLTDYNTGFSNSIPTYNQPSNPTETITVYDFYDAFEENSTNLLHSGRVFLGNEFLYSPQQSINFDVPNIVPGQTGVITLAMAARSPVAPSMITTIGSTTRTDNFALVYGVYYQKYVDYKKVSFNFTQSSSDVKIDFSYSKPTSSSNAWIDFAIINAKCSLKFYNQLQFQSTQNIGDGNVSKFQMTDADNDVIIWDITSPTLPQNIDYSLTGSIATFNSETDTIRKFFAFKQSECLSPVTEGANVGEISNQNLHNVPTNTDMIIVAHPIFLSQANQIAAIHKAHDNLNCEVVTTEQIYNEFSSGMKDVPAIRNYFKMVYEKTNYNLKYALLFGDGSYDNFNPTDVTNPNFIPTYQTYDAFNLYNLSTTSDDFFTFLDANEGELTGAMDISAGRFPVKNQDEANTMVNKLQIYYDTQNFGDWHNTITLTTDDRDKPGDAFTNDAESLSVLIDTLMPFMNIKKIYLDAYPQVTSANGQEYPDAVLELNNRINDGTLIVNYLGHGSEHALTSESLVTTSGIRAWNNQNRLPLFITGTCEFSRFDNADPNEDVTSAGEMIILNPNGGGFALLTTARVSYSSTNRYINEKFYKFLFAKNNDNTYNTIGDAYMKAKNSMSSYHKYLFTLLGDPAIRLQYPENNIVPTTLNGNNIASFSDTLQALDSVTISGYVTNYNNEILTDFNGILTLSYFDKKRYSQTLNNDGNGAMNYWSQYNKLFRGRAAVTDGYFHVNFIIPKDIYYSYGLSKFSFYAQSDVTQASGQNRTVVLGGINPNAPDDDTPPKIRLFMNDSSFVSGGITDANPSVFAIILDDNGINTSSASIGHDITAMLDNNPNNIYSLNEYYQSDLNNFKQGSVTFQIYKLDAGAHSIKLKAWDIQNNSAEKTIEFVVVENNNLTISHLLNYPNPFTTNTNFYFEHNKPGVPLDILLQITTVSGKIVKTIHTQMTTNGYRSDPINWNGLDDFEKPIGRGVYIYSIKIRTPDGKNVQKFEKLLLLK